MEEREGEGNLFSLTQREIALPQTHAFFFFFFEREVQTLFYISADFPLTGHTHTKTCNSCYRNPSIISMSDRLLWHCFSWDFFPPENSHQKQFVTQTCPKTWRSWVRLVVHSKMIVGVNVSVNGWWNGLCEMDRLHGLLDIAYPSFSAGVGTLVPCAYRYFFFALEIFSKRPVFTAWSRLPSILNESKRTEEEKLTKS